MKKFLSIALACMLTMSLATVAFAATNGSKVCGEYGTMYADLQYFSAYAGHIDAFTEFDARSTAVNYILSTSLTVKRADGTTLGTDSGTSSASVDVQAEYDDGTLGSSSSTHKVTVGGTSYTIRLAD